MPSLSPLEKDHWEGIAIFEVFLGLLLANPGAMFYRVYFRDLVSMPPPQKWLYSKRALSKTAHVLFVLSMISGAFSSNI